MDTNGLNITLPKSEFEAAELLAELRWGDDRFRCDCGSTDAWHLESRPRVFECADCGKQQSVTAGTLLHRSRLPLAVWFLAVALFVRPEQVSAAELSRRAALPYGTAWKLLHRVRDAMMEPEVPLDDGELIRAGTSFRGRPPPRRTGNRPLRVGIHALCDAAGHVRTYVEVVPSEELLRGRDPRSVPRLRWDPESAASQVVTRAKEVIVNTHGGVSRRWAWRYLAGITTLWNAPDPGTGESVLGRLLALPPCTFASSIPHLPSIYVRPGRHERRW